MGDEKSSPSIPFVELLRVVELVTKYGAALGLVGLGTALLYDFVFTLDTDSRLLSAFVLSDHIQTAASTIPVIICTIILLALIVSITSSMGWWLEAWRRKFRLVRRFFALATVILIIALLINPALELVGARFRLPIPGADIFVALLLVVFAWGLGYDPKHSENTPAAMWSRLAHPPLWVIFQLWCTMTVVIALLNAMIINKGTDFFGSPSKYHDLVTLDGSSSVRGRVVRVIERGVIMYDPMTKNFSILPKDQVKRIELFPRV